MVRFKYAEILEKAERAFEDTWLEVSKLVGGKVEVKRRPIVTYVEGKPHPLMEVIQWFRKIYLSLGFEEVINPIIVDDVEVKKQYGPEALAILDRCYYLAVLPRPDVGMGREEVEAIKKLGVEVDELKVKRLQEVLHAYKKGEVDSDDLVERISGSLEVDDVKAIRILTEVFTEFKELKPETTRSTLRSHITTAWFPTLAVLQHRKPLPIKLFTVGIRFRREQREDESRLRTHHAASCVVMDEEISIEEGRELAEALLRPLGLNEFKHVRKKVTAKYYAFGTEHETYVNHRGKWIEVANFGLYNPISLAHYKIEHPVLNLGIGVERVAMVILNHDDVRELVYPQFYAKWVLSDEEVASMISLEKEPITSEGKLLTSHLLEVLEKNKDTPSPCEILAFKGIAWGAEVEARLYESDPNVKLVGPAAFNKIYVYKGSILGLPTVGMEDKPEVVEARRYGVDSRISYAYAILAKAVSMAESLASSEGEVNVRVRMAHTPSDLNINIDEVARKYIQSIGGKIDLRGPVFIGVKLKIRKNRLTI